MPSASALTDVRKDIRFVNALFFKFGLLFLPPFFRTTSTEVPFRRPFVFAFVRTNGHSCTLCTDKQSIHGILFEP
jgi:hypothetical protein